MISWQDVFSGKKTPLRPEGLKELKSFLDEVHIRNCLVRPWQEGGKYPIVESRELLPSFDTDMVEHKNLPAFSLVAFDRPLDSFSEIFQYDKLFSPEKTQNPNYCSHYALVNEQNLQILASRLPKHGQALLREKFTQLELTGLDRYEALLPFLLDMDRAQVLSRNANGDFHLSGVFASFPSDIDTELKRFGMRIGKFVYGDSEMYERNRMFVYQFLMELYGFPIVSERRTASALFARKLHKMGENFLLRVLGQTDRVITTYLSDGENRRYPVLEKQALVVVPENQRDVIEAISRKGFFLDADARVVILRVRYRQHRYDPNNLQQDRALSVDSQEVIHPITGEILGGLNIIKDTSSIFLRLNDIVRGEYSGRIVYKHNEVVENTDTEEKRLKFLYTWLSKHRRRMISYSDEFYNNVTRVITSYLQPLRQHKEFDSLRPFFHEVRTSMAYIRQARQVRVLQDIGRRQLGGRHLSYAEMSAEAVRLLKDLQFEMVNFFPELVDAIIRCVEEILHNRYLVQHYVEPGEASLTPAGQEIHKNYGRLVALLDSIRDVRKARLSSMAKEFDKASVA